METDFTNEITALSFFSKAHPDAFVFIIVFIIFLKTGSNAIRAIGCAISDIIKAFKVK